MGKWYQNKQAIYIITNLITGKFYIGSAVNYIRRFTQHKFEFKTQTHDNLHFLRAWNKYGEENFSFNIIEFVDNKEDLLTREQYWMDLLKPEYNIRKFAASNLGCRWKLGEDSKTNISKGMKKIKKSKKHLENISKALTGRVLSEETKLKISNSKKGKPWTKARRNAQIVLNNKN